jgi:hypothetical protein
LKGGADQGASETSSHRKGINTAARPILKVESQIMKQQMNTELISNEIGFSFLRPRKVRVSDVIGFIILGIVIAGAVWAVIG